MCAWLPHTLQADGPEVSKPQRGLTSCGAQLAVWGGGEISAWSLPLLLERVRLPLLNPDAKGSQFGSAWEPSSCWLGGLRLRIETSEMMPRLEASAQLPPGPPSTTSRDKNNRNSGSHVLHFPHAAGYATASTLKAVGCGTELCSHTCY